MRSGLPSPFRSPTKSLGAAGLGLVLAVGLATPVAAGITGVCPDGSIFIVQSERDIPCPHAKQVDPHEVPPLRPEYLPRPYTWEVYQENADPNNPYNLIDSARKVRELRDGVQPEATAAEASALPGPAVAAGPPRASGPVDLGLSEAELRDLFQIVELSQQVAPAGFVQETADGREVLRIALAFSEAFSTRVREARRAAGQSAAGSALLFTAVARQPETFGGHFTFVQGHLAFQPESGNPDQLAVVQGHLGALRAGEVVLGYVVLPAEMELRAPLDLYYHDRRRTVTFRP